VTNPLVSLIIPVYNGEEFLRSSIESALAQDYSPYEVIVVDDGSTDGSAELAKSFPEVRYVHRENGGVGEAKNTGIAVARGEIYANVDADDTIPPWKLRVQVEYLRAHPEITCAFGRQEWINPPPWLTRDHVYGELDGIPLGSGVLPLSVLRELGGFDDSVGGDVDFLIRLKQSGHEFAVVPDIVLYRRAHGSNMYASKQVTSAPLPLVSLKAKLDRDRARAATEGSRA
jgi:glycosyltransferase involved in cell wall biosynthesis